jgi:hypothetical protein
MLLDLIDGLTAKITQLDEEITGLLARGSSAWPESAPAAGRSAGLTPPGCDVALVLSVIERLDEISGPLRLAATRPRSLSHKHRYL